MIVYVTTPRSTTGRWIQGYRDESTRRTLEKQSWPKAQDQTNASSTDTNQVSPARQTLGLSSTIGPYSMRRMPSIVQDMQREMDSLARGLLGDQVWRGYDTYLHGIKADIQETKHGYTIKVDIPGVGKDAIEVTVDPEGVLSILGERKHVASQESGGLQRVERSYGRFQRSFQLPKAAKLDEVSASLENGVLTVDVGKKSKEESGVRTIPVADSDQLPMHS